MIRCVEMEGEIAVPFLDQGGDLGAFGGGPGAPGCGGSVVFVWTLGLREFSALCVYFFVAGLVRAAVDAG